MVTFQGQNDSDDEDQEHQNELWIHYIKCPCLVAMSMMLVTDPEAPIDLTCPLCGQQSVLIETYALSDE